jgi:hypothetical protein
MTLSFGKLNQERKIKKGLTKKIHVLRYHDRWFAAMETVYSFTTAKPSQAPLET